MLPDHVLLDKAIDAANAESPNLNLTDLEKRARDKVASFKALVNPPEPKPTPPAPPEAK